MIAFAKPDNVIAMPQKQYLNIVPNSSRSNEWFTPYRYIEAARLVLGGIDLDPASCTEANLVVRAKHYYTKEDNGLMQPWYGCISLNPPYGTTNGKSNIGVFTRKLVREYKDGNVKAAIVVTTTKTDTSWFRLLWEYPICFADHLVEFRRPDGKRALHPVGTAFTYLGNNEQKFIDIFSTFGTIAKRVSTPRQTVTLLSLWNEVPS